MLFPHPFRDLFGLALNKGSVTKSWNAFAAQFGGVGGVPVVGLPGKKKVGETLF